MAKGTGSAEPIIIKKYANRRLYDTSTSSYVTLDHLSELVREGRDFEVRDAKTGEDLTRQVLTRFSNVIRMLSASHGIVLMIRHSVSL